MKWGPKHVALCDFLVRPGIPKFTIFQQVAERAKRGDVKARREVDRLLNHLADCHNQVEATGIPALMAALDEGELLIFDAARIALMSPDEQAEALRRAIDDLM